jgi:hypothetical protein
MQSTATAWLVEVQIITYKGGIVVVSKFNMCPSRLHFMV